MRSLPDVKSAIVYASVHHGNTEKVAKAMGKAVKARVWSIGEAKADKLKDYKMVGFGSGIYFVKHHQKILEFVKKLPIVKGKKAFIFSTAGVKRRGYATKAHKALRDLLKERGFDVVGEFNCPGFDTYGILKLIGGRTRGTSRRHRNSSRA
jgi:flavodoxin